MSSTYTLFGSMLLACIIASCQLDPHQKLIEQAQELDSINNSIKKEITRLSKDAHITVFESGMRELDVKVTDSIKDIRAKFDSLIQPINAFQSQFVNNDLADSDYPDWNQFEQNLIDLTLPVEKHQYCDDSAFHYLAQLKKNPGSSKWSYINMTSLESNLLDRQLCWIEELTRHVGAADLKFDTFYSDGRVGIQFDTSGMNYVNESYEEIVENRFENAVMNPLSTFSIDVDVASYSNIRRFIKNGFMPPRDAVRLEELINYFKYDYPQPKGDDPISITTDLGNCPWNNNHSILKIGLQGKDITVNTTFDQLPPNNLVFLIDVSGSMDSGNKLPLVKKSLKKLTNQLRSTDKISIVVYAGAAGVVLEPTAGSDKDKITTAIDQLQAGGSTAGGHGIKLAYQLAKKHYIKSGNNRVVIATDGDFNVGPSRDSDMYKLIGSYRKSGIYITCLGFGMGNYKDSKLETIADHGNGNYAYIDSEKEAEYVLESGFAGTLYTIAKDVKLKVEFNPNVVHSYRLIGYENRIMPFEDYDNDEIDAGDLGSGHNVTALYELILVGDSSEFLTDAPDLKYLKVKPRKGNKEIATVSFRYKRPDNDKSDEVIHSISSNNSSPNQLSLNKVTAVAEFGLLLRESKYKGSADMQSLYKRVQQINTTQQTEKWSEFQSLVGLAMKLEKY